MALALKKNEPHSDESEIDCISVEFLCIPRGGPSL